MPIVCIDLQRSDIRDELLYPKKAILISPRAAQTWFTYYH